jgi:MFS family permease
MSITPHQPLAIALLVAGAFFMENLDGTVIATALPQMAESFRASPVSLNIGLTAYIVWPGLVAPVLGPPVGGFITTYATWRWIFFLNVPLGLLGIALTALLISNDQIRHVRRFDWLGFLYCGMACTHSCTVWSS